MNREVVFSGDIINYHYSKVYQPWLQAAPCRSCPRSVACVSQVPCPPLCATRLPMLLLRSHWGECLLCALMDVRRMRLLHLLKLLQLRRRKFRARNVNLQHTRNLSRRSSRRFEYVLWFFFCHLFFLHSCSNGEFVSWFLVFFC